MPVTGTRPVMAMMLTTTWASIQENTPTTNRLSSVSAVLPATFKRRSKITAKIAITMKSPIKPKVSPMMAKTESLMDSGK